MAARGERRSPSGGAPSFVEKRRGNFWANGLLGAVAVFVIGAIPLVKIFAPFAGGTVAGYLQNTGTIDGVKVGAVAGIIGSLGLDLLAPPRLFGLLGGGIVGGPLRIAVLFGLTVWTVTSAVGGAIGATTAEG